MNAPVRIWIDTGGTFTDCVALWPDGRLESAKVLSTGKLRARVSDAASPERLTIAAAWPCVQGLLTGMTFRVLRSGSRAVVVAYDCNTGRIQLDQPVDAASDDVCEVGGDEEAPLLAARLLTGTPYGAKLPPVEMRVATTLGTNALLERKGHPPALFITKGFRDLLLIGDQQRQELYSLDVRKPAPLYACVVEVPERIAADGTVLMPLDLEGVEAGIRKALDAGCDTASIALMNSYRNSVHENALASRLLAAGFTRVTQSCAASPLVKILPRAHTALIDSYLAPVLDKFVSNIASGIDSGILHLMTSAGGLVRAGDFRPRDCLFSGPAGGVVGAAAVGAAEGLRKVISFDMGGTSTDVSRFDGDFEYVFQHEVGPARLNALALAIETVASGGGSICSVLDGRLKVGPESAGSAPGPACYGDGGPLTLTDVNLLLGRIAPSRFEIPVCAAFARDRFAQVLAALKPTCEPRQILEGFVDIADELMAEAIRNISVRRGYDPADYALVAFGGAGPQHSCGVAERLGITRVIIPADSSLLSAVGLGHSRLERFSERQVLRLLDGDASWLERIFTDAEEEAVARLRREGVPAGEIEVRRRILNLRFKGQETPLSIEYSSGTDPESRFLDSYAATYGHRPVRAPIEVESLRVVVSSGQARFTRNAPPPRGSSSSPVRSNAAIMGGERSPLPVYDRDALLPGALMHGPALIVNRSSSTFLRGDWQAEVSSNLSLILTRQKSAPAISHGRPEVVQLEIFAARLSGFVSQMGEMLRRCSVSTNIKERLDYSCALLDPNGALVASALHIPVHIGAMGLCVRSVLEHLALGPGDVAVTNSPAYGGTHLPDVTVISSVYSDSGRLLGYLASRAHHSEIGGISPGSMPAGATRLIEEGVHIPPRYLVKAGIEQISGLADLLNTAPFPSRALTQNIADIRAAMAANATGAAALRSLAAEFGEDAVLRRMGHLKERAREAAVRAISRLATGTCCAEEFLDDGTPLRVAIECTGGKMVFDFAGTGGESTGSLNATPAIVTSAVLYTLRLLCGDRIDLNEGMLDAVSIRIPPGLLSPDFSRSADRLPAVAGGNVETSQRIVDLLLKALGLAACSQGTMNNVTSGNPRFSYYETICGGTGATSHCRGADAVHSHMTNTRITDPEIMELLYPLRVEEFAIREGSGGEGLLPGGNGARRALRFLEPCTVSMLSQHRKSGPYGMAGGLPGSPGEQRLVRSDGTMECLKGMGTWEVKAGDMLVIETPGGGGWGPPEI